MVEVGIYGCGPVLTIPVNMTKIRTHVIPPRQRIWPPVIKYCTSCIMSCLPLNSHLTTLRLHLSSDLSIITLQFPYIRFPSLFLCINYPRHNFGLHSFLQYIMNRIPRWWRRRSFETCERTPKGHCGTKILVQGPSSPVIASADCRLKFSWWLHDVVYEWESFIGWNLRKEQWQWSREMFILEFITWITKFHFQSSRLDPHSS